MDLKIKDKTCRYSECSKTFTPYLSTDQYCSYTCKKLDTAPAQIKVYPRTKVIKKGTKLRSKPISRVSKNNSYFTSTGERLSKATVDARVRKAKEEKLAEQLEEHGYNFCEDCNDNECTPIDCSHDISVNDCQKSGRTELAWDKDNITIRGRKCHEKHG